MNLKKFFETTGIKQNFIAEKANLSPATLHKAVLGYDILLSTAIKICIATDNKVTPYEMYKSLINENSHSEENKTKKKQKNNIAK